MDIISLIVGSVIGLFIGLILGLFVWRGVIGDRFENLASSVLERNNEEFVFLANKNIDTAVKPIREKLDTYSQLVIDIERNRNQAYGAIDQQLKDLIESQRKLEFKLYLFLFHVFSPS